MKNYTEILHTIFAANIGIVHVRYRSLYVTGFANCRWIRRTSVRTERPSVAARLLARLDPPGRESRDSLSPSDDVQWQRIDGPSPAARARRSCCNSLAENHHRRHHLPSSASPAADGGTVAAGWYWCCCCWHCRSWYRSCLRIHLPQKNDIGLFPIIPVFHVGEGCWKCK